MIESGSGSPEPVLFAVRGQRQRVDLDEGRWDREMRQSARRVLAQLRVIELPVGAPADEVAGAVLALTGAERAGQEPFRGVGFLHRIGVQGVAGGARQAAQQRQSIGR
ncbi:hypothetical protein [Streptomyces naphthomycinicus]|uniref:hypothetical protein n=1 Tax=Streptomyces naphthomycinicus TaxID=2872625 RepID=UPI001CEC3C86|nr:hypothetical protein [Streptomyces sp. TML10]